MYKHILIATDGSELAEKAVAAGLQLAKAAHAEVTALTVTEPWDALAMAALAERGAGNPIAGYETRAAAMATQILSRVTEAASKAGVSCAALHVKDQPPAQAIVDAAKERGCDLIVMSSHGRRGLSKVFLGSQAARVVTLSSVPVLVCR